MKHGDRLLVATGNAGKLAEVRALLAPLGLEVTTPADVGWDAVVEEDGETLEANAARKALTGLAVAGIPALADDTGLFVEALHGAPGVHSARYAGEQQDPAANRARLLEALRDVPPDRRRAVFRCVLALAVPGRPEAQFFSGECRGRIVSEPRGTGGFGYDPLFQPLGEDRTFAEMSSDEKNRISHRGRALERFRASLIQELRKDAP